MLEFHPIPIPHITSHHRVSHHITSLHFIQRLLSFLTDAFPLLVICFFDNIIRWDELRWDDGSHILLIISFKRWVSFFLVIPADLFFCLCSFIISVDSFFHFSKNLSFENTPQSVYKITDNDGVENWFLKLKVETDTSATQV